MPKNRPHSGAHNQRVVRLREDAMRKQDYKCFYCQRKLHSHTVTAEHLIPVRCGGPDKKWNIVAACRTCNNNYATFTLEYVI